MKRPLLADLARRLGLSLGTVSQALRNDGRTSRATCARVQALAQTMGYRPDPVMAAISSRKRHRPGALSQAPIMVLSSLPNPQDLTQLRYHRALRKKLMDLGYAVRTANVGERRELPSLIRQWYHQGVRGIVFSHMRHPEWIRDVDWGDFSLIMLGAYFHEPVVHDVRGDTALGARMLIEHALRGGRHPIGMILHEHGTSKLLDDQIRHGLAVSAQARHSEAFVPPLLLGFDDPYQTCVSRIAAWHAAWKPRTVIGFRLAAVQLAAAGLRPGHRLIFLELALENEEPDWTGVMDQNDLVASLAAEWLDGMIRRSERGVPAYPVTMSVPPMWGPPASPRKRKRDSPRSA